MSEAVFVYDEGTEVVVDVTEPVPGARSEGLRLLSARAEGGALDLRLESRAGRTYRLRARSSHRLGQAPGVTVTAAGPGEWEVRIEFPGPGDAYVRRALRPPVGTSA